MNRPLRLASVLLVSSLFCQKALAQICASETITVKLASVTYLPTDGEGNAADPRMTATAVINGNSATYACSAINNVNMDPAYVMNVSINSTTIACGGGLPTITVSYTAHDDDGVFDSCTFGGSGVTQDDDNCTAPSTAISITNIRTSTPVNQAVVCGAWTFNFQVTWVQNTIPSAPGGVLSAIWLKADAGVTTGATFTWADQSGNTRNGTQSTAANQPTVNSSLINFNPALVFDGTNDYLNLANLAGLPTGAAAVEAFGVARNLNTAGSWNHMISYGGTAANSYFTLGKQTGTANAVTAFNATDAISTALEYASGATVLQNGKYTGSLGVVSTFGTERATTGLFTGVKATTTGKIGVDPTTALSTCWNGNIAETALFPGNLSTTQVNQVNSYLAIKYGITKAGDYIATDGTTITWAGGGSYHNEIAGIGLDMNTALNQKQSASESAGNTTGGLKLLTIAHGTAVAASNAANANSFLADKTFLVWGANTGTTAFGSTAETYLRMNRVWFSKASKTVGNVRFRVAASVFNGATKHLVINATDPTFAAGNTVVNLVLNGSYYEATVDMTSRANSTFYFSFAQTPPVAPGGVMTGLNLWLKADADVYSNAGTTLATNGGTVQQWNTQIGSLHATQTTAADKGLFRDGTTTQSMNFNPVVEFVSNDEYHFPTNLGVSGTNPFTIMAVTKQSVASRFFGSLSSSTSSYEMDVGPTNAVNAFVAVIATAPGTQTDNFPHISTTSRSGNTFSAIVDGGTPGTGTNAVSFASAQAYDLGSAYNGSNFFLGSAGEFIVYNSAISAGERQRIDSYLALKYGVTKAGNYLASDGTTTVWTTGGGYDNEIAGIAQDMSSALLQKQSASESSTNTTGGNKLLTIALGNSVAASNALNMNSFAADKTYLVWGSNAGATTFSTAMTLPDGAGDRMARVWKANEVLSVSNTVFRVPLSVMNGSSRYLVVNNSDATFASGNTFYPLTVSGAFLTATVDLTSRANSSFFFTFAQTPQPGPGGVTTNLTLWYDAANYDAGTGVWTDQSALANNGTTNANGTETVSCVHNITGTIVKQTAGINFNTSLAVTDLLRKLRTPSLTGPRDVFVVCKANATSPNAFGIFGTRTTNGGLERGVRGLNPSPQWNVTTDASDFIGTAGSAQYLNGVSGFLHNNQWHITVQQRGTSAAPTDAYYIGGYMDNNCGGASNLNRHFDGDIAEVIVYNTGNNSATNRQKIESYLAIKYGITKVGNYLASDGTTTTWTSGGGYDNNITGIGRDNLTALAQKQSKSINAASLVTIGNGGQIAASNSVNSTAFAADKTFLVFGDNAAATTFSTAVSGDLGVNRMTRIWRAQETATVGQVKFSIPVASFTAGSTPFLYISSDAAFDNTDQKTLLVANGANYEATVNLSSRANSTFFFTFAESATLPVSLTLAMTASASSVTAGNPLNYVLTVANTSANVAYNVQIKDKIPPGVTVGSVTPSVGTWDAATKIWTIPALGPAPATATLTINTTVQ